MYLFKKIDRISNLSDYATLKLHGPMAYIYLHYFEINKFAVVRCPQKESPSHGRGHPNDSS